MITVAKQTRLPERETLQLELAQLTLATAVPIEIEHLRVHGGPDDYQREAARQYIERQALGEAVMYVTKGQTADQMRLLIEICAIMAFQPGGVAVCGLHFEACPVSEVSE